MNCFKCNCRLNHLQLREMIPKGEGEQDLYAIECFNPNCREMNYLSREGYLTLRKEITLIAQYARKLNCKIPGEMKILLISMERSGSSWVAAHLSIEHVKIFGILPLWNHECDRRYAVFKSAVTPSGEVEIVTPKGWTSVYDVNPKEALEKDFDKVILLEKGLDALKEDICKYNHPEKWELERAKRKKNPSHEHEFLGRLRIAIERAWNEMFAQEIDDPRLYRIKLEELNDFTEWEWMKLIDWLGFPERLQCHPFAVNRNWQVHSDVLPTNYPLCPRLRQLEEMHPNLMAQELLQEELFFTKMKDQGRLMDRTDYPFVNKVNPYLQIPGESIPMEATSYRIDGSNKKDVVVEQKKLNARAKKK